MINKMIAELEIWKPWKDNYNKFVPQFIEESKKNINWQDWNPDVFQEFFEKNRDQCVASLQQGYYSNDEKLKIKNNWNELGQMLSKISNQQDVLDLETYDKIRNWLRQHTSQNRKASANRLIASLQPKLLCTIVNEDRIKVLMQRINKNDSSALLAISNNWFENSNKVLNYFKSKLPDNDYMEIITYPWQIYEILNNQNSLRHSSMTLNNNDMSEIQNETDFLDILYYKKQIILQGPPGTGKTREAKLIANNIFLNELNENSYFGNNLIKNETIFSVAKNTEYRVKNISENYIELEGEDIQDKKITKNKIIDFVKAQNWNAVSNGNDRGAQAIAYHLYQKFIETQFKIIQFHPSYTYEDFVRGIVAESKGDKIEYKNVNKNLGEFAELALKNYKDSQKDVVELSLEKWVDEEFKLFVDDISEILEKEKIQLTDNVDLVDLMDDAFLYIGENWKGYEHRMSFNDIKRAYLDKNVNRKDIVKNENLTGSARQHATYYILVLKKFIEFLKGKKVPTTQIKIEEKPFILVIDEINRANLSSVLGELIYALEYRGEEVESMYSVDDSLLKNKLILPPNLYIIGTMNTADRSVGHIDYAIRRRFAFVDVLPKNLINELGTDFKEDIFAVISSMFVKNYDKSKDYSLEENWKTIKKSEYLMPEFDPKDVWLGHSYFIQHYEKDAEGSIDKSKPIDFKLRLDYEIKPIIREYVKDGVLKDKALDILDSLG